MPASSHRRPRVPGFMMRLSNRKEHVLFANTAGDVETLFSGRAGDLALDEAADDDSELGVESLAPPLPPPLTHMTEDSAVRVGRAVAELRNIADRAGAEVAANALEIGCLIARRILESELKADVEAVRQLVRSAVRRLGDAHKVTIHLAPVDIAAVRAAAGDAPGADVGFNLGIAKVELLPDTNLTPGDCFVESDAATVDGRIGTRIEEIRRVLAEIITERGPDND